MRVNNRKLGGARMRVIPHTNTCSVLMVLILYSLCADVD